MQILDSSIFRSALLTVAASTVTLGGGVVVKNTTDIAVNASHIEQLEKYQAKTTALISSLSKTNKHLAVLNERLDNLEEHSRE